MKGEKKKRLEDYSTQGVKCISQPIKHAWKLISAM